MKTVEIYRVTFDLGDVAFTFLGAGKARPRQPGEPRVDHQYLATVFRRDDGEIEVDDEGKSQTAHFSFAGKDYVMEVGDMFACAIIGTHGLSWFQPQHRIAYL